MQTAQDMRTRIIDKATADADYRAMLVENPRAAVADELGVCHPQLPHHPRARGRRR